MPRISSSDFKGGTSGGSGGGFSVPWKGVLGIGMIAVGVSYGVYQYERFNPKPQSHAVPAASAKSSAVAGGPTTKHLNAEAKREEVMTELGLTPEQKQQIAAIESETTNTRAARQKIFAKVLTPEQRDKARELRQEADAKRKEMVQKRQEKRARLYPGGDLEVAAAKDKEIQERRKAAKAAASGEAPGNAGNQGSVAGAATAATATPAAGGVQQ